MPSKLIYFLIKSTRFFNSVAKAANTHFWPALIDPGENLSAQPEHHSSGTEQEMQLELQFWFDAWNETPGAIGFIKTRVETSK